MLESKIKEYQVEKSLNDIKEVLNDLLSDINKMSEDIKSIYNIIDEESNCYLESDTDINIIKQKANENSKALDKIYEIVDKYV